MDNSKLKYTSGGGCLALFGLPFLLAGLGIIASGLAGHLKMEGGGQASIFFYLPFGGIFALVGSGLVFGRSGTTLDSRRRIFFTWWGMLFPFSKSEHHFDDFDQIKISQKIVRSDKSTRITYPVDAIGPGDKQVTIHTLSAALEARRIAEQVAKLMNLGVKDVSRGTEVVREAGTLDETVKDRILRRGVELELTAAPAGAKSQLDISGDKASFEIPAPGFGLGHIIMGGFLLIMGGLTSAFFGIPALRMTQEQGGPQIIAGFWCLIGLTVLLSLIRPVIAIVSEALATQTLSIDKNQLRLDTKHPLGKRQKSIPLAELEELELVGNRVHSARFANGQQIQAVSDKTEFRFGGGLDYQELCWMKNTLEYMISKA